MGWTYPQTLSELGLQIMVNRGLPSAVQVWMFVAGPSWWCIKCYFYYFHLFSFNNCILRLNQIMCIKITLFISVWWVVSFVNEPFETEIKVKLFTKHRKEFNIDQKHSIGTQQNQMLVLWRKLIKVSNFQLDEQRKKKRQVKLLKIRNESGNISNAKGKIRL